ncbi:lipocalin family protein [Oceanococcus atlanticus]|uniref:lipocalin family protein n=1 Tax=Oceanococcus atlanticus TaxID=1317117 RepID=UPI001F0AE473|nr:lipocalin family protein [Oceanococcus atlanticus]
MQRILMVMTVTAILSGCSLWASKPDPIPAVDYVDLPRFMGDWYVIGFIPIGAEADAHNGIESYRIGRKGKIDTVYRYLEGGFDGPLKTHTPNAKVEPGTGNARWGMQFVWPLRAEYVISYLDDDYQTTIIARSKRDYVWLMAREPHMSDADFARYRDKIGALGYDTSAFVRQPQRWPENEPRPPIEW